MPRGYWYVILAAFGWLIFAALPSNAQGIPQKGNKAEAAKASNQIDEAAKLVSAAIRDSIKPSEGDPGCPDRQEKRSSDLCAQWQAADAAKDAAEYAFWTLLVSVAGTGLLVWTLWETRATSRRELRAYVSVQPQTLGFTRSASGTYTATITILVRNGDVTPAYNLIHGGNVVILSEDKATRLLAFSKKRPREGVPAPVVLHSTTDTQATFEGKSPFSQSDLDDAILGRRKFYMFGIVEYSDTFRKSRRTSFCYEVMGHELARPTNPQPSRDASGELHWIAAPFHNDAN